MKIVKGCGECIHSSFGLSDRSVSAVFDEHCAHLSGAAIGDLACQTYATVTTSPVTDVGHNQGCRSAWKRASESGLQPVLPDWCSGHGERGNEENVLQPLRLFYVFCGLMYR